MGLLRRLFGAKRLIVWNGVPFHVNDRVRLRALAGSAKPEDTGHSSEVRAGPGQTGTVLGVADKARSILRVSWDAQEWEEWDSPKRSPTKVMLGSFQSTPHVDWLEHV